MAAAYAQSSPPSTAGWSITASGTESVEFHGAENMNLFTMPENTISLNSFSLYIPNPSGPAASTGVSSAISSGSWTINGTYLGPNGLPDPADAPPVVVELYSEAQAGWAAVGNASGANSADDALGGVSTAQPTAFVSNDQYQVFQPSNGQFSLGTMQMSTGCSVTGAQSLGLGGELLGTVFNYPEIASPSIPQYYSKGPNGAPVADVYQPDGSITVDLPLTAVETNGSGAGSTETLISQFSLYYNDNTDSVDKPWFTWWTSTDSGPTTALVDLPLLSYTPVTGGTAYSLVHVDTTEDVTLPQPTLSTPPSMPALGSTTIKADLLYGKNPAGDILPSLSNVFKVNWHYVLENPVSAGTSIIRMGK